MRPIGIAGAALLAALTAACVPRAEPPAPAPLPPREPLPSPPPAPTPVPPPIDWTEAPLSPGDWRYRQENGRGVAIFSSGTGGFGIRCDARGSIELTLEGSRATGLHFATSYGDRSLAARAGAGGTSVTLASGDPLLDQIAFSRGRFMVRGEGGERLILPAWPEIARVVEDCRQ